MFERSIKLELENLMRQYPVVTITGPRQSGKTTLVRDAYPNRPYYNLENPDSLEFILSDPREFFNNLDLSKGVILDEIPLIYYVTSRFSVSHIRCSWRCSGCSPVAPLGAPLGWGRWQQPRKPCQSFFLMTVRPWNHFATLRGAFRRSFGAGQADFWLSCFPVSQYPTDPSGTAQGAWDRLPSIVRGWGREQAKLHDFETFSQFF